MSRSHHSLDSAPPPCIAGSEGPDRPAWAHLAALVESSHDAIIGHDPEGRVTSWNAAAETLFGYRAEEMIGRPVGRLLPPALQEEDQPVLERLRQGERIEQPQTQRLTRDGQLIDVAIRLAPIRDGEGRMVGASQVARDLSAQTRNERDARELARMTRLYAALSHINQAIVWSATRDELLSKVCRVLVEHGGLKMAWIGWNDRQTHTMVPATSWGDDSGYLMRVQIFTDERLHGRGPSALAFRSGQAFVCNDLLVDPATEPSRVELVRAGYLSCASFPVRLSGEVRGALTVYSDRRDVFYDKEIALLTEAAGDLSFALDNFSREEARRRAEQQARDEMRFSDAMLDSMPGVVYFYDLSGRFLRWNRNFETVSGFDAAQIGAMHPLDFFSEADRPRVEAAIAQVFATGESSVEAEFVSSDGRRAPYFFTGRRTAFQDRTCLIGVGIDITARRRAEKHLHESQARLLDAQRLAGMGSWELDLIDDSLSGSAQTLAIFGVDPTEAPFSGRHFLDFVHPDDRDSVVVARQAALEGARRLDIQHRIVLRNGGEKVVHQLADLKRDADGRPLRLTGTVHDVTARVRLEAEREARHRAEAADMVKSAFLATMSHELRTPLNSIIGFTGIILNGLAGPLNEEQAKQLGMVRSSARHLLALVNDVLDISKIEAGQLDIACHPFDLRTSLEKVLALVAPQAQARELELRVSLAADLGTADTDQRRFEQIALNLLSNAVKFTERGSVELKAELDAAQDGTEAAVRMEVSDTGIGIRPADLASLFQPFRQLDSGLARVHEGTGLGLAISDRLAKLMGGQITAHSEWGVGSRFTVVLPLHGPQGARAPQ